MNGWGNSDAQKINLLVIAYTRLHIQYYILLALWSSGKGLCSFL